MINMREKRTFILFVISFILLAMMPSESFAVSRQKTALLNYSVSTEISGEGSLYFDYGENMAFFLKNGYTTYNSDCKVKSNSTYKFSKAFDRGFIPVPEESHYFAGFYDASGKKISLTKTVIDILRVSVDGIYYYDYYDAYENSKYVNYTEAAYKKKVKAYLKALYGTTRYKVMDTTTLYEIPKKDATYSAKFEEKTAPNIKWKTSLTKTYGNTNFYVIPNKPSSYTYTFKSSNKKVVTVDSKTGYTTIAGPGIATITCSIAETETTLAQKYTTTIIVKPAVVTSFQASQSKLKLYASWKNANHNSGYEIQVSNNKSFANILASKTIRSGRYSSTTIKLKQELCHNYARIRAYKISNGEKIYGPYTVKKITKE